MAHGTKYLTVYFSFIFMCVCEGEESFIHYHINSVISFNTCATPHANARHPHPKKGYGEIYHSYLINAQQKSNLLIMLPMSNIDGKAPKINTHTELPVPTCQKMYKHFSIKPFNYTWYSSYGPFIFAHHTWNLHTYSMQVYFSDSQLEPLTSSCRFGKT